jgi:hypothetical protein
MPLRTALVLAILDLPDHPAPHLTIEEAQVLEAVCVTLDVKPAKAKDEAGKSINDYWKPSVGLMNEKDFLQKLKVRPGAGWPISSVSSTFPVWRPRLILASLTMVLYLRLVLVVGA